MDIEIHLTQARKALKQLEQLRKRNQQELQLRQEMKWLAENKTKFRGKWVALLGDRLLAAGATAKEVFAEVAGEEHPPLVIQVERDELPFAGW